ncbi:hypothetical protein NKT77_01885 [Moraxella sp. FZLJ2107]|uniref:hypothetical protein n=1 Tax=unclassified Moraxella TaxID=2685852 RepID=UPI0020C88754|nr:MULTISPECIES: hypothetical protein [unclassified Moraxella]UTO05430.1 hypothetical protein NKT77_01885 [Moraxella sp. FZLJ2107]UTO22166.1 hypothetical protein NKU06_10190 [Moraxella sp. FZLJ2109]
MINLDADAKQITDEYIEYLMTEEGNVKIEQGPKPTEAFIKTYANFFPRPLWYIWEKIGFACLDNGGFVPVNYFQTTPKRVLLKNCRSFSTGLR